MTARRTDCLPLHVYQVLQLAGGVDAGGPVAGDHPRRAWPFPRSRREDHRAGLDALAAPGDVTSRARSAAHPVAMVSVRISTPASTARPSGGGHTPARRGRSSCRACRSRDGRCAAGFRRRPTPVRGRERSASGVGERGGRRQSGGSAAHDDDVHVRRHAGSSPWPSPRRTSPAPARRSRSPGTDRSSPACGGAGRRFPSAGSREWHASRISPSVTRSQKQTIRP